MTYVKNIIAFALIAVSAGAAVAAGSESEPLYFPPASGEWQRVDPASVGWDAAKLDAVLDFAGKRKSSGVVILYRGRILAERHWDTRTSDGADRAATAKYRLRTLGTTAAGHAIEDVASVQKSVAAMLTGAAQHRGLLSLDDSVSKHLGEGWSKAPPDAEAKITIRHLITMSSGLANDLTPEAPAGTKWRYNTAAYAHTMMVLEAVSGMDRNDLTRDWLTGPIGMKDSKWAPRRGAGADSGNAYGFATTARDLARFGLLVLANGQWDGTTVLPDKQFIADALKPSQKLNPSYGYLWWLNGQSKILRGNRLVDGPLIPSAPPDTVAALGALQRKLYVVPSMQLVVTRIGDNPGGNRFDEELWELLSAAAPKK